MKTLSNITNKHHLRALREVAKASISGYAISESAQKCGPMMMWLFDFDKVQ